MLAPEVVDETRQGNFCKTYCPWSSMFHFDTVCRNCPQPLPSECQTALERKLNTSACCWPLLHSSRFRPRSRNNFPMRMHETLFRTFHVGRVCTSPIQTHFGRTLRHRIHILDLLPGRMYLVCRAGRHSRPTQRPDSRRLS